MIFYKELKKYRESKRWTKKVMSEFLYNTNYETYVRWENGGNPPHRNIQYLIIEKLLGRSIEANELEG